MALLYISLSFSSFNVSHKLDITSLRLDFCTPLYKCCKTFVNSYKGCWTFVRKEKRITSIILFGKAKKGSLLVKLPLFLKKL